MYVLKTNLGYFQPVTSNIGLKELRWQQKPFSNEQLFSNSNENVSRETLNQIELYLLGYLQNFSIPLDFSNWSLKMVKWFTTLSKVPYGKTISYKELANDWGNNRASRAAGDACKRNPIPIIIPCHRILNINGKMGRYSGGNRKTPDSKENMKRKRWLINLETNNN
tara:strand:+ start:71 stop:568 length:498 start_codon:yes stop_codon:yes gene_type:complete